MGKISKKITQQVRDRDGNRCRGCGAEQSKNCHLLNIYTGERYPINFDVHHIDKSDDHSLDNLLTLCRQCHVTLHQYKGKKHEQYKSMVKSILETGAFAPPIQRCETCGHLLNER